MLFPDVFLMLLALLESLKPPVPLIEVTTGSNKIPWTEYAALIVGTVSGVAAVAALIYAGKSLRIATAKAMFRFEVSTETAANSVPYVPLSGAVNVHVTIAIYNVGQRPADETTIYVDAPETDGFPVGKMGFARSLTTTALDETTSTAEPFAVVNGVIAGWKLKTTAPTVGRKQPTKRKLIVSVDPDSFREGTLFISAHAEELADGPNPSLEWTMTRETLNLSPLPTDA